MIWNMQTWHQLAVCSRCLVRQIEKHAGQNLFLLGGEKEAMNWMNRDFWLVCNDREWKRGSLGIVNVMICMWWWQFWSLFWNEWGASADYWGADQQRLQSFSAARVWPSWTSLAVASALPPVTPERLHSYTRECLFVSNVPTPLLFGALLWRVIWTTRGGLHERLWGFVSWFNLFIPREIKKKKKSNNNNYYYYTDIFCLIMQSSHEHMQFRDQKLLNYGIIMFGWSVWTSVFVNITTK